MEKIQQSELTRNWSLHYAARSSSRRWKLYADETEAEAVYEGNTMHGDPRTHTSGLPPGMISTAVGEAGILGLPCPTFGINTFTKKNSIAPRLIGHKNLRQESLPIHTNCNPSILLDSFTMFINELPT